MRKQEQIYESPSFEIMEIRVEGCFAASLDGATIKDWEDDGDNIDL